MIIDKDNFMYNPTVTRSTFEFKNVMPIKEEAQMTKHYCDRCGKLLGEEDFKYPIHIQPTELCVRCATEWDATNEAVKAYEKQMWVNYWGKKGEKDACKSSKPNEAARA